MREVRCRGGRLRRFGERLFKGKGKVGNTNGDVGLLRY